LAGSVCRAAGEGLLGARLEGICKNFGPLRALDDVSVDLTAGEIRALVGENGAGKTTLMSVLYGMLRPDRGRVIVDGTEVGPTWCPREAMARGIGMLHQHFSLVPTQTVLENILLPQLGWTSLRPQWRRHRAAVSELCERYGFHLPLDARLETLAVGQQQQVEIMKLLYQGARLLILDEPTSVLTPQQTRRLLDLLLVLRDQGHTVVLITHKLPDALDVADQVTVLRSGRVVATVRAGETTGEQLARLMVSREMMAVVLGRSTGCVSRQLDDCRPVTLRVEGLSVPGAGDRPAVDGVTLEVRQGEIVGVAGVSGNGQRELAEAIVGLRRGQGRIVLAGFDVTRLDTHKRLELGLRFIPEDRHAQAMFPDLTIQDNLVLERLGRPPLSRRGLVRAAECRRAATAAMREFDVRAPGPEVAMSTLSGGNQQKVVLARALADGPKVIIACQPTRGLDFAATAYVRERLRRAADTGVAVLLISSELEELLALSDRLIVMYQGRVAGEFDQDEFDVDRIGLLMTGQGRPSDPGPGAEGSDRACHKN